MLFTKTITVPAGTAATSPTTERIKIAAGIIHQIEILFPDGCNGTVYVTLSEADMQFWPTTRDMSISGSGGPVRGSEFYEQQTNNKEVTFKGWSPSADYDHDITVYIWVLPKKVLLPTAAEEGLLGSLSSVIRGMGMGGV